MKLEINKETITATLDDRIEGLKSNIINVDFGIDVSGVPDHVFNYMFGILLSEQLSWSSGDINFGELNATEAHSIQNHIKENKKSNPYGKANNNDVKLIYDTVDTDFPELGEGPVLCCNGMGKDGIATMLLAQEIRGDVLGFTIGNQYRDRLLYGERMSAMNKLCDTFSLPKQHYIETDFFQKVRYKVIPWWVFGLPLAFAMGSEEILAGVELTYSKKSVKNQTYLRPNDSVFSLFDMNNATSVRFGSPTLPLTTYGCQKLLVERYPKALKYQRSCMHDLHWCKRCKDCYKTSLYLESCGSKPIDIGLLPSDGYKKKLINAPENAIVPEIVENIKKKLKGEKYDHRFEMCNSDALKFAWERKHVDEIFSQHFKYYEGVYGPYKDYVTDLGNWVMM